MSDQLNQMIGLLEEMGGLCDQLLPLIDAERQALIQLRFDQLPKIAESKNGLVHNLIEKKDQAKMLIEGLTPLSSLEKPENMAQLLPLLSEEVQQRLSGPYLGFKAKAREVDFRNSANLTLAEEGMKTMEAAIADLAGLVRGDSVTYRPPGQSGKSGKGPLSRLSQEV